ncbi:tetratricopeptide repeat protein [Algoriphagus halophytocola]|uniref:Tetratricopeptide repeat protein n=1 Tax=Algoriphagus halophytocola TaxID=2991499 RepID=A0ABY6MIL6_9BACT|nr:MULTISPECIES: tetratricopeptide repeat protein [unclassified Algoriphagus]UZD22870.1 tetratricopeptide repeat protein [Algoriphagus sp. TR-M5]WBL44137.1 tetratricopeptide repeat protein [Algoriphagus sp. TR-M9]
MSKDLNITPIEYELIEAKLDGTLADMQMKALRELEAEDADWSLKVEEVKALRQDLESYLVKTELDKIHEKAFPAEKSKTRQLPQWIWGVAAAIALILVGWISFQFLFTETHEKLFTTYYETDPGLITAMSGTDSYEFDRGMVDFKEGKYEEALALWQPLLEEKPTGDTLLYFVAMANLELENYIESQEYLEKILTGNPSEFKQDAEWYLGLLYLRNGQTEKAKGYFSNSNKPEAKEILEKLE